MLATLTKGSMPTEMFLHWAKWKVEDDLVLLVDITASSSYTKFKMT